jgi:hypothetical protein
MSGATYILKSALNKILDGYIWQLLGLPVFTIIIPGITSIIKDILKKAYNLFSNIEKNDGEKNKKINRYTNIFKKIDYKLTRETISFGLLVFLSFRLLSPLSVKIKTNPTKNKMKSEKKSEDVSIKKNEKFDFLLKLIKDLKFKIFEFFFDSEKIEGKFL